MRRLLLAVGAAAVAVAAALLLLYFTGGGFIDRFTSGSSTESPRVNYLLQLEVEGAGRLLVNGTSTSVVNSSKPFRVVIEALPEACHALKRLLVNGTPVEESRLELSVRGNTTVKAVFTRICALVSFMVSGDGLLLVNGSRVVSGSELKVAIGSTLRVELETSEFNEAELYVNGSKVARYCPGCPPSPCPGCPMLPLFITVKGDTELAAVFRPRIVALRVDTGGLSTVLSSGAWVQQVNGSATVMVEAGKLVNVTTFCLRSEGEELLCAIGWLITYSTPLGPRNETAPPNCTLLIRGDIAMKAIVSKVKSTPPQPARGIVRINGGEAPAALHANPFELPAKPWTAKIEYIGDATWLIDEPTITSLFLELPRNWSIITIEIWVEYSYPAPPYLGFYVVTSEYPEQLCRGCASGGAPVVSGAYLRVVLTRRGEVVEMPKDWDPRWCGWYKWNPLAKEGWLYIKVRALRLRLRVTLQP